MLGRALVMTGEHDRAAAAFDEAARLARPDDPGTAVRVLLDASSSAMITPRACAADRGPGEGSGQAARR